MKTFYDRQDITKIFGITLLTVVNWENKGKLKASRISDEKKLYAFEEVYKLMEFEKSKLKESLEFLEKKQKEYLEM